MTDQAPLADESLTPENSRLEQNKQELDAGLFEFYASQAEVMLAQYDNINQLLGPTEDWTAPGTHCEVLLRELLRRNLPSTLSVDKGFVYGRRQVGDVSKHCPEIDILIHDSFSYRPVFRLDDFVIVQPEAVRAVIQVKRTLTSDQLKKSVANVVEAKQHIRDCTTQGAIPLENVFSAAIFFEDNVERPQTKLVSDTYKNRIVPHFENFADAYTMPDYVGSLKYLSFFFDGLNGLNMHYKVYESIHNGKNAGLQAILAQLSRSVLPSGMQSRFRFPNDYLNIDQFVFYESTEVEESNR